MFKIRVVNPGKGSIMRNSKGQYKKKGSGRRRRRRANPEAAYTPNPPRRRRRRRRSAAGRRSAAAPQRRRRRQSNPSSGGGGGGGWGFQPHRSYNFRDAIPFGLSTLAQAWVVRRWGDPWGTGALGPEKLPGSGYAGQAWSLKNYLLAAATGWVGAKVVARSGMLGGSNAGAVWWRASVEHILTRLLWTEVIGRWDWGVQQFGQVGQGGKPGDIYDDGRGNRWLCSAGGQWVSMQGYQYGELVRAGPMGMGELVRAGPMGMHREGQPGERGDPYDTALRGAGSDAYRSSMVGDV